jgi:hypothetical protein
MDKVTTTADIVQREVELYNEGNSYKAQTFAISDLIRQIYAVVVVPDLPRPFPARVVVMAHIVGDYIVIDEDTTDKPLVDALMINGSIPREQIILAYAGETIPEQKSE